MLLNDAEIRELTGEPNLARAARAVMEMGPRVVVAKRGEYGAALFTARRVLRDPRLSARGRPRPDRRRRQLRRRLPRLPRRPAGRRRLGPRPRRLRQAMAYGSVIASFNVEDFGTERVGSLTREEIEERLRDFRRITHFEVEAGHRRAARAETAARTAAGPRPGPGRAGSCGRRPPLTRPSLRRLDQRLALRADQLPARLAVALERVLDRDRGAIPGERGDAAGEARLVELAHPLDRRLGDGLPARLDLLEAVEGRLRRREAGHSLVGRPRLRGTQAPAGGSGPAASGPGRPG